MMMNPYSSIIGSMNLPFKLKAASFGEESPAAFRGRNPSRARLSPGCRRCLSSPTKSRRRAGEHFHKMSFPNIPSVDIGNGIRRSPLFKDLQSLPYPEEPDANTTCKFLSYSIFPPSGSKISHAGSPCNETIGFCVSAYSHKKKFLEIDLIASVSSNILQTMAPDKYPAVTSAVSKTMSSSEAARSLQTAREANLYGKRTPPHMLVLLND